MTKIETEGYRAERLKASPEWAAVTKTPEYAVFEALGRQRLALEDIHQDAIAALNGTSEYKAYLRLAIGETI